MPETNANNMLEERIEAARLKLEQLWGVSESEDERQDILRQMLKLDKQAMRGVARRIDQRSERYRRAAEQLRRASEQLDAAIRDVARVQDALDAVARAAGLLAQAV